MSKLVIWDWDNTLMNTRPAVTAGLQDVAEHYHLPPITAADVLNVMTAHRGQFWQERFKEKVPEAVAYYVERYYQHMDLVRAFDETETVLKFVQSRNIPQIILSNKNHEALQVEVARHGLTAYFAAVQGTTGPLGKPEYAFAEPFIKTYQPQQIILIGDGISDMEMAQTLGATAVMVHQPNKALPHDYDCGTLSDVLQILKTIL